MTNLTQITDDEARKTNELQYSTSLEKLIKCKAEECEILSQLHLISHKNYKNAETYYNIPIIGITATLGFVSALNIDFSYINIIIGGSSLVVSLLKSIYSYLQIGQKSENHRVASIQYHQISNEIRIELSLSRDIRQPANYLLNLIKIKMKNLQEVSGFIPEIAVTEYLQKYEMDPNFRELSKPDILTCIKPIEIFSLNNDPINNNNNNNIEHCIIENNV